MNTTREVYIVDDSADQRHIIKTVFSKQLPHYPIRLFEGGKELYEHLIMLADANYTGGLPGLIILDLKMPQIDGYELLKLLRRSPKSDKIDWATFPIAILSSYDLHDQIAACQKAGANSFYKRPGTIQGLYELFSTICQYWIGYHRVPVAHP